jgi:predicted nucleic-acid-binding protein
METFDTNVVLRLIYRDDPEQAERASRAWRGVELAWVLRVAAKFERAAIAAALGALCDSEGVTVDEERRVRRALVLYETGPADFSDYLLLEAAREIGALPVVTFDQRFAKEADVVLASTVR